MVALSSCEAEYIIGAFVTCQAILLNSLLKEIRVEVKKPLKLLIDNKSTINLAKNPISHGRSKHIEAKFHFLREKVNSGLIKVVHCPTNLQIVDVLTKTIKVDRFELLRKELGVIEGLN